MNETIDETDYSELRQAACLTIAGSDSGGNAGVQADLRAFHSFGVHGCTVFTALTAQNPFGVNAAVAIAPEFVSQQFDAVIDLYDIRAMKSGMLATAANVEVVAERFSLYPRIIRIADPVMIATSGAPLLEEDAVELLKDKLLPNASLITPNIPEAMALADRKEKPDDLGALAKELAQRFQCPVLLKGGHDAKAAAEDLLADGHSLYRISTPIVESPLSTHGTGCSLSAAIAASAACGRSLLDAVVEGKAFVYETIRTSISVGDSVAVLGIVKKIPVDQVVVREEK
ncbi:MAG: bifunctional hydroxymethylpyrimidine kinase/phosphomethylpyrimidine kinase [Kiritimatiellae bacterium]|nr:bifunctional hydroxymethylpyrimidine kinase/phosphomethylpyrimidine kinase [Kiritimatiellia bacterium]